MATSAEYGQQVPVQRRPKSRHATSPRGRLSRSACQIQSGERGTRATFRSQAEQKTVCADMGVPPIQREAALAGVAVAPNCSLRVQGPTCPSPAVRRSSGYGPRALPAAKPDCYQYRGGDSREKAFRTVAESTPHFRAAAIAGAGTGCATSALWGRPCAPVPSSAKI